MDRLTDVAQGYCEMYCKKYCRCFAEPETCEHKAEVAMYEKLKEIEGIVPFDRLLELAFADRAGRCVVMPVKVGDSVYLTNWSGLTNHTIYRIIDPYFYTDGANGFSLNDFGKTVFLTHEAAEAALKQNNE